MMLSMVIGLRPMMEAVRPRLVVMRGLARLLLREEDLREHFVSGWGKGGQKTNRACNCVDLTHVPTGLRVKCHQFREREANRKRARSIMRDRVEHFLFLRAQEELAEQQQQEEEEEGQQQPETKTQRQEKEATVVQPSRIARRAARERRRKAKRKQRAKKKYAVADGASEVQTT